MVKSGKKTPQRILARKQAKRRKDGLTPERRAFDGSGE